MGATQPSMMWVVMVRASVVLGLLCSGFAVGWGLTLALCAVVGVLSWSFAAPLMSGTGTEGLWRSCLAGARIGVSVTAAVGLIAISAGLAALVVLTFTVTHPAVRRTVSRMLTGKGVGSGKSTTSGHPGSPTAAGAVHTYASSSRAATWARADAEGLTDEELCLAWRQSFLALDSTIDAATRAGLAAARGRYLDELTRRHPREMDAWLTSGARAAGNPLPYLSSHRRQPPPGPPGPS